MTRLFSFALMAGTTLLIAAAPQARAEDKPVFDDTQKQAIEKIIAEYLVSNPKIVMDAAEAYQRNQEKIQTDSVMDKVKERSEEIFNDPTSPVVGNKTGDVTIVEFFDYNCGYCKIAFQDIQTLIEEDKNLRVVLKELPILSESSAHGARYALAADKQGKYWEFHQFMMKNGANGDDKQMESLAKEVGIDFKKLKKDAEGPEIRAVIEKNMALARDVGFTGTPGFVVGDTPMRGHYGIDAMRKAIADKRAQHKTE